MRNVEGSLDVDTGADPGHHRSAPESGAGEVIVLTCPDCRATTPWLLSCIHTWRAAPAYKPPRAEPRAPSFRAPSEKEWKAFSCWQENDAPQRAHVPDIDLLAFPVRNSPRLDTWGKSTTRTGTSQFDRWHGRAPEVATLSKPAQSRARFDAVIEKNHSALVELARHRLGGNDDTAAELQPDSIVAEAVSYALSHHRKFRGDSGSILKWLRSAIRLRVKRAIAERALRRRRYAQLELDPGDDDESEPKWPSFEGFNKDTMEFPEEAQPDDSPVTGTDTSLFPGGLGLSVKSRGVCAARAIESALVRRADVRYAVKSLPSHQVLPLWERVVEEMSRQEMIKKWDRGRRLGDMVWRGIQYSLDDLRERLADYAPCAPRLRQPGLKHPVGLGNGHSLLPSAWWHPAGRTPALRVLNRDVWHECLCAGLLAVAP